VELSHSSKHICWHSLCITCAAGETIQTYITCIPMMLGIIQTSVYKYNLYHPDDRLNTDLYNKYNLYPHDDRHNTDFYKYDLYPHDARHNTDLYPGHQHMTVHVSPPQIQPFPSHPRSFPSSFTTIVCVLS